jgi:hypothetical protein
MIPRQSIAPGYGGMSAVEVAKQSDQNNQSQVYQQQRMSSSGKQASSNKMKAAPGSSTKKQGAGGTISQTALAKSPNDMVALELNDIDLRLSENVVDSGKLDVEVQPNNARS